MVNVFHGNIAVHSFQTRSSSHISNFLICVAIRREMGLSCSGNFFSGMTICEVWVRKVVNSEVSDNGSGSFLFNLTIFEADIDVSDKGVLSFISCFLFFDGVLLADDVGRVADKDFNFFLTVLVSFDGDASGKGTFSFPFRDGEPIFIASSFFFFLVAFTRPFTSTFASVP